MCHLICSRLGARGSFVFSTTLQHDRNGQGLERDAFVVWKGNDGWAKEVRERGQRAVERRLSRKKDSCGEQMNERPA